VREGEKEPNGGQKGKSSIKLGYLEKGALGKVLPTSFKKRPKGEPGGHEFYAGKTKRGLENFLST